ncbi:hypothetical protein PAXRUDRAFT_112426, partial [Paxillus rubicundulus Ve08.2h10]
RLPARRRNPPREWWRLSPAQLDHSINNDEEDEDADMAFSSTAVEPRTFAEAMRRPDAEQWHQAALDELAAHKSNGTWHIVNRPIDCKVIGARW